MARIITDPSDAQKPRIDRADVEAFFEQRAQKYEALGPLRTVIYQDKHPDLAERRDAAEKELLAPKLALTSNSRVLDIGCGTGRWTDLVAPLCAHYHGVDISSGLVSVARARFAERANIRFSVCSADELSLAKLDETKPFDRIMALGLLIYLNDDEVERALKAIASTAMPGGTLVLLREPIGVANRLTIKGHYSADMDQTYNAIYRTREELLEMANRAFTESALSLLAEGDVFSGDLNNRADTRQRWFAFGN